jgi:hypothetical protein
MSSASKSAQIAIGLVALILLIALVAFALNSFDAPLSTEAKALLAAPMNPYRPQQNLYVAFAGFDASSQQSVIDTGTARIEAYDRALDSILRDPSAAVSSNPADSAKLIFKGDLSSWKPLSSSIWTSVRSHRTDIADLLAANQQLYQRYLALHQLPGYFAAARPSYFMPPVYLPQPVHVLFLANVADRIQTGTLQQQQAALAELSQDLRMWKRVLRGNGDLSSKMIAAASLQADLLLLADMIADPNADMTPLEGAQGAAIFQFDPADWKIGEVFGTEFRMRAAHFMTLRPFEILAPAQRPWTAFTTHFFKVNAALNLSAAQMLQLAALANSEPAEFSRTRATYHDWLEHNEKLVSPTIVYDPVGKILVATAAATWDDFPLRVYDVAALQRLVYLALQLRIQGIDRSEVASFLTQHPQWSTHPVDGQRFGWNPVSGELAVKTVAAHPRGQRFSVIIRPAAATATSRRQRLQDRWCPAVPAACAPGAWRRCAGYTDTPPAWCRASAAG